MFDMWLLQAKGIANLPYIVHAYVLVTYVIGYQYYVLLYSYS